MPCVWWGDDVFLLVAVSPTFLDLSTRIKLSADQQQRLQRLLELIGQNRNEEIVQEMGMPFEEWPEVREFFGAFIKEGFAEDNSYSSYYNYY